MQLKFYATCVYVSLYVTCVQSGDADIVVTITEADHPSAIVRIETRWGTVELLGEVTRIGRELRVTDAHVQGLYPGALGRAGLNAIARKLIEEADVDTLVIEGSPRTTGAGKGRRPKAIRFPNERRARRRRGS